MSRKSSSSLPVVEPRVGRTMNQLSPCFSVECLVDQLSHAKSSPWCDVVDPICLWPATSSRSRNRALNNFLFQTFPIFLYNMPKISHFPFLNRLKQTSVNSGWLQNPTIRFFFWQHLMSSFLSEDACTAGKKFGEIDQRIDTVDIAKQPQSWNTRTDSRHKTQCCRQQ